jgi:hypothetical protein
MRAKKYDSDSLPFANALSLCAASAQLTLPKYLPVSNVGRYKFLAGIAQQIRARTSWYTGNVVATKVSLVPVQARGGNDRYCISPARRTRRRATAISGEALWWNACHLFQVERASAHHAEADSVAFGGPITNSLRSFWYA